MQIYPTARDITDTIMARINKVEWSVSNTLGNGFYLMAVKLLPVNNLCLFASRFIAYLLGEPLQNKELEVLEEQYCGLFFWDDRERKELPQRLFEVGVSLNLGL